MEIFFSGIFAIIGIIIGYFIGAQKHVFEKTYDLKLICIKDLYKQIVELEFILKKYVHFIGADFTEDLINKK